MSTPVKIITLNVIITACIVLAFNFLCGIGLHLFASRFSQPDGALDSRATLAAYLDHDYARQVFHDFYRTEYAYHPFTETVLKPFRSDTTNIGANGERITPGVPPQPRDHVRLFGGSTMWGTGVHDRDTIAAVVQRLLPDVAVHNHGQSGFTSRQDLEALFNLMESGHAPGTVVFYEGVNEVAIYCGSLPHEYGHSLERVMSTALDQYLDRVRGFNANWAWAASLGNIEALIRLVRMGSLREANPIPPADSRCRSPEFVQRLAENLIERWQIAHDLVSRRHGRFLAVLQPVSEVGSPNLDYIPGHQPVHREQYRSFYGHVRRLVSERRLPWVRIPIYPARDSDLNPATHSDPFPAVCSDAISASWVMPFQQVFGGHLMARGFRSRLH